MKHSICSRCEKKASSRSYPAKTDYIVTNIKAKSLGLGSSRDATGKIIETCNLCTSPVSRIVLDTNMGFDRYEPQLLNIILYSVEKNKAITTIDANSINNDTTRYDLVLTNASFIKDATKALLIEIDEKQHFKMDGKVDGEMREKIFFNKYAQNSPHVLRIRVSEDGKTDDGNKCMPTLSKSGQYVCIENEGRYRSNVSIISRYIDEFFSNHRKYKIAYINMSDDYGIRDMNNLQISYGGSSNDIKKLAPKWSNVYKNTSEASKPFVKNLINENLDVQVSSLVSSTKAMKISNDSSPNPDGKKITCMKSRCKEITASKTGFCKNHR